LRTGLFPLWSVWFMAILVWRCSTWNTQCYREESPLCQIVQEGEKL